MNTIVSFDLDENATTRLQLPYYVKFLAVGVVAMQPTLWVELDDTAPAIDVDITPYIEGASVPNDHGAYVGTSIQLEGGVVRHYYAKRILTSG